MIGKGTRVRISCEGGGSAGDATVIPDTMNCLRLKIGPQTFGEISNLPALIIHCTKCDAASYFGHLPLFHTSNYLLASGRNSIIGVVSILKDVGSRYLNPYPTAFPYGNSMVLPYGNSMVLHFYQQQESSTTKTVHKVINKGLKAYV